MLESIVFIASDSFSLSPHQLLCATITLQSFLTELEDEHMAKFGITWLLVNQHLFHQVVYSDPIIQKSLPGIVAPTT